MLTLIFSCSVLPTKQLSNRRHGGIHVSDYSRERLFIMEQSKEYNVNNIDLFISCFYTSFLEWYPNRQRAVMLALREITIIFTKGSWQDSGFSTTAQGLIVSNNNIQGRTLSNRVIIVSEKDKLNETALAHELMHLILGHVYGNAASDHNANLLWSLHAETVIIMTNNYYKGLKDGKRRK